MHVRKAEFPFNVVPKSQGAKSSPIGQKEDRPSWWIRAGIWTGVMMAAPPPKVWGWNPSVITLIILIAGLIGGGGYYLGRQDETIKAIQKTADEAKSAAATAKDIAITGEDETPTPSPTPEVRNRGKQTQTKKAN